MTPKSKALWVAGVTCVLTTLVTVLRELEPGNVKAIWLIWAGLTWNYFAYGVDRGMMPRGFVELDGGGKGNPVARSFVFWLTAAIYLTFIATAAFADIE
jgi:hypothetical protein